MSEKRSGVFSKDMLSFLMEWPRPACCVWVPFASSSAASFLFTSAAEKRECKPKRRNVKGAF